MKSCFTRHQLSCTKQAENIILQVFTYQLVSDCGVTIHTLDIRGPRVLVYYTCIQKYYQWCVSSVRAATSFQKLICLDINFSSHCVVTIFLLICRIKVVETPRSGTRCCICVFAKTVAASANLGIVLFQILHTLYPTSSVFKSSLQFKNSNPPNCTCLIPTWL